jgi:hypothetical protein
METLSPDIAREELIQQYDRYIDQVRTEAKDLYWLYNFFFVVDSALLGSVLIGKMQIVYMSFASIVGILLSLYWFMVIHKQRLWRNDWVRRIQIIEHALGYERSFQMWAEKVPTKNVFRDYVLGKRGLWRFLFLLPIGFMMAWAFLILVGV